MPIPKKDRAEMTSILEAQMHPLWLSYDCVSPHTFLSSQDPFRPSSAIDFLLH